jgi:hypothetical protein
MKRYLALLLLLIPALAFGQSTTVSGTVIDTDSQAWTAGTVVASFVPAPGTNPNQYTWSGGAFNPGASITISITAGGNYSGSIPSNTAMNLSGSKWTLTANSGTTSLNTQSQTLSVTGGTQTVNFVPAGIRITAAPGAVAYSDLEVAAGLGQGYFSINLVQPRVCSVATGAVCSTWIAAGGGGITSVKGATDAGSSTIQLVDTKYNFPGTAQWSCQAGISNGSNIVTLPASDRVFTGSPIRNAQVGDIMWAANAQCGGENAVIIPVNLIARGTITSVDSATQVHVSNTASATCTVVNKDNCVFVWGPDATIALQNAWTDAGNTCGTLILPAGGIITLLPPNNTTAQCPGPAGGNDIGSSLTVMGQGPYVTMLLTPPIPASWGNTMFADPIGGQRRYFHDFGVASFAPAPAVLNAKVGFNESFYSEFYNVSFLNWYPCDNIACSNTFIPLQATGVGNAASYVHDNICLNSGSQSGCINISGDVYVTHNSIQNTNQCLGAGSPGAGFTGFLTENSLVLCGIQGAVAFGNGGGGTQYSTNDTFSGGGTSLACIKFTAPQTVYFKNVTMGCGPTTTGPTLSVPASVTVAVEGEHSSIAWSNINGGSGGTALINAGTVTLRNTSVTCAGTCTAINNSGTLLFKEGNVISGGAITNTGTIQVIEGEGGYQGACTGVVTSGTTVALFNLGETATTTCSTAVGTGGQVATKAGTIYALYCTATAGNQATDACTVVKNGAAQTMTCSLNGVATCTDGTVAHWVSYVQGDILAIEVIGGAATTLANVKGVIVAP